MEGSSSPKTPTVESASDRSKIESCHVQMLMLILLLREDRVISIGPKDPGADFPSQKISVVWDMLCLHARIIARFLPNYSANDVSIPVNAVARKDDAHPWQCKMEVAHARGAAAVRERLGSTARCGPAHCGRNGAPIFQIRSTILPSNA
jgi:hypothetical protein